MSELIYNVSQKVSNRIAIPVTAPTDMVRSGTFMYPLTGIYYFLTHSAYWSYYLNMLAPQIALTAFVYVMLIVCLYPLCVVLLVSINGPMAILTSWYLILDLCTAVSQFFSGLYLFPTPQKYMFDSIMSKEGADDVVLQGKLRRIVQVPFFNKVYDFFLGIPRSVLVPFWIVRFVSLILIARVPLIGGLIVSLFNAPSKGVGLHSRYFALKGMDERQIKGIYRSRRGQYMGFGIVAGYLESIPVLGIFFMFTNTVGAALWAASIEKQLKAESQNFSVKEQKSIQERDQKLQVFKSTARSKASIENFPFNVNGDDELIASSRLVLNEDDDAVTDLSSASRTDTTNYFDE